MGLQRTSQVLKYVGQAGTEHHHHLTLSFVLTEPLWQEVSLKRSGSELGLVLPVKLLVCLS